MVESYLYYQWDKATLAAGYSFSHEALFGTFKSVEEEVSSMFHLDVSKTAAPRIWVLIVFTATPFFRFQRT